MPDHPGPLPFRPSKASEYKKPWRPGRLRAFIPFSLALQCLFLTDSMEQVCRLSENNLVPPWNERPGRRLSLSLLFVQRPGKKL